MRIESEITDMVKRKVRDGGSSGVMSIPKAWVGKYVIACLLPEDQQRLAQESEESR